MKTSKPVTMAAIAAALLFFAACGGKKDSPTSPSPTSATLTAPALESPSDNEPLDTLRPTLVVRNATSDQQGTRTYEFQISDSTTFSALTTANITGLAATVGKTGVAEGTGGKTSFTVEQDLQPTTVFYWRARAVQGSSTSAWSTTGKFKSRLVGFLRAGELYDPLIHGETVGTIVGSTRSFPVGGSSSTRVRASSVM